LVWTSWGLFRFEEVYGKEKRIAWILGGGISFIMVFVWPLLMLESVVQDQCKFNP